MELILSSGVPSHMHRLARGRFNHDRRSIADDFGSRIGDLRGLVSQADYGIPTNLDSVFQQLIKRLSASRLTHLLEGPDFAPDDVLEAAHDAL